MPNYDTKTALDILAAWEPWVITKMENGWTSDIFTFPFSPLPGSQSTRQVQMVRHIQNAYGLFVTRVVRKPRAASQQDRLPIWLCYPDLPVFKRERKTTPLHLLNDGLHYQAFNLLPPWSRTEDCVGHFVEERDHYRRRCQLEAIDVEPITHDIGKTLRYLRKSIIRDRFPVGDELVLPRCRSELSE